MSSIIEDCIVKRNIPYGIRNYGNTCYINTAIQTLASILSNFCINGEFFINDDCDEKFIRIFSYMIASIENNNNSWKKKHVLEYSNKFIKYILKLEDFSNFSKYEQADSYEFLSQMINILSKNISYKISIDISISEKKENLSFHDRKKLLFFKYLKKTMKTSSYIHEKLCGYFRVSLSCSYEDCDNISERFEPFFTLLLPIKKMNTLEECLKKYISPITLDKENKWYCDKCKRKTQAVKKMSIWSTSEYLIISYKRYMNIMNSSIKDDRLIYSPLKNLDMNKFVESHENNMYDLLTIVYHIGNLNSGHYVCARKINKKWFIFDDEEVQLIDKEELNKGVSYYLVYQRKK